VWCWTESDWSRAAVHGSGRQAERDHIPLRRARVDVTDSQARLLSANQNHVLDRVCRCSFLDRCIDVRRLQFLITSHHRTTATIVLRPLFRNHPGSPVPEENFWTLWCKGRLTEADTPTIRLHGRHSIWTNQCPPPPSPIFFTGRMPFLPPNQQRQSTAVS